MERQLKKIIVKIQIALLNHIKIFNKNWNYFENMNDQEIEFLLSLIYMA